MQPTSIVAGGGKNERLNPPVLPRTRSFDDPLPLLFLFPPPPRSLCGSRLSPSNSSSRVIERLSLFHSFKGGLLLASERLGRPKTSVQIEWDDPLLRPPSPAIFVPLSIIRLRRMDGKSMRGRPAGGRARA